MSDHINYITYTQIKTLNKGNRWKTDKVVEYYIDRKKLFDVTTKSSTSGELVFQPNGLTQADFKYRSIDFEPPIGLREWIAWGLLLVSIIANIIIAVVA
ncbi:hypothetical protein [Algoriphagus sp. A40]|uniref:hypothetical protein n=1 Tax=Algoriphagus sp. A40 TaxID=1945863 RepID=UPI0009878A94|nr:hypothetical protein [Algoriphagus sp. A40]OOG76459.1 hypothetical protein B0E43_08185 [Algoriphagus sp. A40]